VTPQQTVVEVFPWHAKPIAYRTRTPFQGEAFYVGDHRWVLLQVTTKGIRLAYMDAPLTPPHVPKLSQGQYILQEAFEYNDRIRQHLIGFLSLARMEWDRTTYRDRPQSTEITIRERPFVKRSLPGLPAHLEYKHNHAYSLLHVNSGGPDKIRRWVWYHHTLAAHWVMEDAPDWDPVTLTGYATATLAVKGMTKALDP
jgi:hypothetical protein